MALSISFEAKLFSIRILLSLYIDKKEKETLF